MTYRVPELLSPAGSLEKLKVAVLYGADAVYLGGQKFGLRSAADNFSYHELVEGVKFAHERGTKVYVVLNSFLHDSDLVEVPAFVKFLEDQKVDAVIVSDLGVVETIKEATDLEIHLSTQASCLNVEAAKLWKKCGVKRVVLGREVSVKDAAIIKKESGLEVELFVHGSMCMAYSGNCVISNYTQGRDSNRGGCAHSCRFEYSLDFKNPEHQQLQNMKSFFMSSKDLEGIRALSAFIDGEIDSIKVEGRMKSHHYAGTIAKVYSDALLFYKENGNFLSTDMKSWEEELAKVTHRDYTQANLLVPAGADSIYDEREHSENEFVVVGVCLEVMNKDFMLMEVRSAFRPGDTLELVPFSGKSIEFTVDKVTTVCGEEYQKTKPGVLVKLPYVEGARQWNLIRKRI